jgi:hypothetical protein
VTTTIEKIENAIEDVLPLVAIALPLIVPGVALPAASAAIIKEVFEAIEAMASNTIDAPAALAKLKLTTAAAIASNDAKVDAEIAAQFEVKP